MVGVSVLAYAGTQNVLWTPMDGDSGRSMGLAGPPVHQGVVEWQHAGGAV